MCGFAGFYSNNNSIEIDTILSMIDKLKHRGPDHIGTWVNDQKSFGFGHARLSILDTSSAGNQPMSINNSKYIICFNGEVYNHKILRKNLLYDFPNIKFISNSDTETILYCFENWGIEKTLTNMTGMFSFALYDKNENKLFISRDRFGEKPLYYGWQNDIFYFASELKSIVANQYFIKEIDKTALNYFFKLSYIPNPYSIYKGINKLTPGTYIEINFNSINKDLQVKNYWSFYDEINNSKINSFNGSDEKAISNLEEILIEVIQGQQISDVPIGAFLSGGIDSTLIVSLMQKINHSSINTFTIGFKESLYNEAGYAKIIAKYFKTNHNEFFVGEKEIIDVIPKIPYLYDEPFADSSQIPTYLVSSLAKKNVTVCLSGDGGDELFGGYNRYSQSLKFKNTNNIILKNLSKIFLNLTPRQIDQIYKIFKPLLPRNIQSSNPSNHLIKIANILNSSTNWEIYEKLILTSQNNIILNSTNNLTFSNIKKYFESLSDNFTFQERMMYTDSVSYLTDDILCKVDRAAMGVSLETRVPFLDHKLASFAWTLPQSMKLRNGEGKWILKQLLYKYVPKNLMERPKIGFGLPLDIWLRTSLRKFTDNLLDKSLVKNSEILNSNEIANIWQNHKSGKQNAQFEIWNILMFTMWQDEWM